MSCPASVSEAGATFQTRRRCPVSSSRDEGSAAAPWRRRRRGMIQRSAEQTPVSRFRQATRTARSANETRVTAVAAKKKIEARSATSPPQLLRRVLGARWPSAATEPRKGRRRKTERKTAPRLGMWSASRSLALRLRAYRLSLPIPRLDRLVGRWKSARARWRPKTISAAVAASTTASTIARPPGSRFDHRLVQDAEDRRDRRGGQNAILQPSVSFQSK